MRRRALAAVGGLIGTLAGASLVRARGIQFSPVTARGRVGADFVERRGLADPDAPTPRGEMDDLAAFARPGFDPARVHPVVRDFYERTADYRMASRARWHRPFRAGAALAAPLTSYLAQLNLQGPREDGWRWLASEFVALAPERDPRDGARAWIRTTEDGEAVFVALYGSHVSDGERLVNIAAPLPGGNLSTALRIAHLDAGAETGVELTTFGPDDPGLYWVTPPLAFALPLDQRFRVWPAAHGWGNAPGVPSDPTGGDAVALATQEMWCLGSKFLTVEYAIVPA